MEDSDYSCTDSSLANFKESSLRIYVNNNCDSSSGSKKIFFSLFAEPCSDVVFNSIGRQCSGQSNEESQVSCFAQHQYSGLQKTDCSYGLFVFECPAHGNYVTGHLPDKLVSRLVWTFLDYL